MHIAPGGGTSYWLTTDRLTFKLTGAETNGQFTLVESVAVPEFGPPPHIHTRQHECFYVLEGEWEFNDNGRTFTAGPGAVVHLPKGQLHTHRAVGATPARALIVYTPAGLERFVEEAGTPVTNPAVRPAPPPMPELERIVTIAMKHGIEVPPPNA